MTNVDLVYQALVIHPKMGFLFTRLPRIYSMTGRRWVMDLMTGCRWLKHVMKPHFVLDQRHIPFLVKHHHHGHHGPIRSVAIWGQQEVFESQLEYHAGAAHIFLDFLGGQAHRCCPLRFFWGVPKRGGSLSYHPARGGRQLGMLSEKEIDHERTDTLILSINYGTYGTYPKIPWLKHVENLKFPVTV